MKARVAVEAAHPMPWHKYVGISGYGAFQCMESFGASAPFEQLYKKFGFTSENVPRAKAGEFVKKIEPERRSVSSFCINGPEMIGPFLTGTSAVSHTQSLNFMERRARSTLQPASSCHCVCAQQPIFRFSNLHIYLFPLTLYI